MSMSIVAFPAEYDADITCKIMDGIAAQPALWKNYFNIEDEKKLNINITNYSGFGQAPQWYDGENIPIDTSLKLGDATLTMLFYGLGFKVTRKHVDYGQSRLINRWIQSLERSVGQTYNVTHANVLNNAFSTTYSQFGSKTLCSTTHTTAGAGTRANRPGSDVALTPANWETICLLGLNWVNYRGINDPWEPIKMVVPPALRRMALKIVNGSQEAGTMDNDINTHQGKYQVISDPFLTSTTAYFGVGAMHGLLSNHGLPPTPKRYVDEPSESLIHGVAFDFVVGPEFPDGIVGTSGA